MHWADINAALYKAGSSPTQVARDLGVKPATVSIVIRRKESSYNIASYLSVVTGIPLNRLFPDGRYNEPPKSKRQRAAVLPPAKGRAAA